MTAQGDQSNGSADEPHMSGGADPPPHPPEADYAMRSRFIHGEAFSPHWDYSHHVVPPISSSATYRLSSAQRGAEGFCQFGCDCHPAQDILIYDRLQEPTSAMLEDRLAEAERGSSGKDVCAVTFATGMAAISAAFGSLCKTGDNIVAHRCLYGCTASLLKNWYPRLGIATSYVNTKHIAALRAAIRPETRAVYLESPVNPTLEIIDLRAVADLVAEINSSRDETSRIFTICDNTFATPLCQRPMEHGIDIVVHSLTKGIGGFGTDMGGVVIAPHALHPDLLLYRKDFGGTLGPKAAWPPLVYGLPTLPVRMRQMQHSAGRIATYLAKHPLVSRVRYPGLESDPDYGIAQRQMRGYDGQPMPGSLVYFTLHEDDASSARAAAFINYCAEHSYCITLAVSLGQVKSLIESPATMTHSAIAPEEWEAAGIELGGIRLSVGLEDTADLIRDLEACFEHVAASLPLRV